MYTDTRFALPCFAAKYLHLKVIHHTICNDLVLVLCTAISILINVEIIVAKICVSHDYMLDLIGIYTLCCLAHCIIRLSPTLWDGVE